MRNNKFLFLITILYFVLGSINIYFSLLGLICMIFPIILMIKNKMKTWCQVYCPRASLYTTVGKQIKSSRKTPMFFIKGNMKWIMLSYFGVSLFIVTMSTIAVSTGSKPPMESLRFLIIFKIPGEMLQLIKFSGFAPWIIHLSYRFYSMMMTTTALGFMLALIYKPRTWCTICPIATISDVYIKSTKKKFKEV